MKNKAFPLYVIIAILLIICLYQAQVIKEYGRPQIIRHSVENGYHNIVFITRDTLALDGVTDTAYNRIINDGILPGNND